mmetsp:Transcript_8920/g.11872  ORF Transcript_8920/g.11872 Transcript_8920/m.11872 type:complete len:341 (+) Transcript_8920:158-1180(+)|eukprot:CAMPEP_0198140882 /NCGR_PEP_ID=MMETSP1443-20131203/3969_1 /TAXON_ID=186043 /ORGANISM="Entomoneis sp., Strain CCMP2396" /LENGTH=340 /DNA_ID=CAMNT_0043803443 /DNA_START=110 /DNA_END=1132 /DNA_ORIENTATION=-
MAVGEPDAAATEATPKVKIGEAVDVTMHPLVLLSAADHYHRVAKGTRKRVVGVLLGQVIKGKVDASNSFAVPFEEDSRNPAVFYLDHNYVDNMHRMFRKINTKERIVGFYSTGPSIRPNDLRIYDVIQPFTKESVTPPVFCIIDVRPDRPDLPVTAYKVVEEVSRKDGQMKVERSFAHLPCQMGAVEAEEIGVEHLLRDINDPTVSTVASLIKGKASGLSTLTEKLVEAKDYLEAVGRGDVKAHPEIIDNLQTIINLLPNLNQQDLVRSMIVKTNDMLSAIYLASIIRTVIALHDLINNKIRYGEDGTEKPKELAAKPEEEKKEEVAKDGDKKKEKDTKS